MTGDGVKRKSKKKIGKKWKEDELTVKKCKRTTTAANNNGGENLAQFCIRAHP